MKIKTTGEECTLNTRVSLIILISIGSISFCTNLYCCMCFIWKVSIYSRGTHSKVFYSCLIFYNKWCPSNLTLHNYQKSKSSDYEWCQVCLFSRIAETRWGNWQMDFSTLVHRTRGQVLNLGNTPLITLETKLYKVALNNPFCNEENPSISV